MAEQVKENYLIREIVPDSETIDIQKIPHITQWSNGSTPKPAFQCVILPSPNGNKPAQDESNFTDICYEDLITEDDEPVDNIPSEKQQRLLSKTLYEVGHLPEPFLVTANVGLFDEPSVPPIVPDILISLGVKPGDDPLEKENRSYFVWKEGKPPEMVLEIVSNREGNETGSKVERYAAMGVQYYIIVDPGLYVQEETLIVHELGTYGYVARDDYHLPDLNLALTLWEGIYEQLSWPWVRWCTLDGELLLTGKEQAEQERLRAEQAEDRVEQAEDRAEQAEDRAEQERLRAEQERLRAEQEKQRAREAEVQVAQEKLRAEQERQRVQEAEAERAEQAQLATLYLAKLREAGIEIDELS